MALLKFFAGFFLSPILLIVPAEVLRLRARLRARASTTRGAALAAPARSSASR
jgi:hypothetical protein